MEQWVKRQWNQRLSCREHRISNPLVPHSRHHVRIMRTRGPHVACAGAYPRDRAMTYVYIPCSRKYCLNCDVFYFFSQILLMTENLLFFPIRFG